MRALRLVINTPAIQVEMFEPHCNQPCNLQLLHAIAVVAVAHSQTYSPVTLRSHAKRRKRTRSPRPALATVLQAPYIPL